MNALAARMLAGCRSAATAPATPMLLNVALVIGIAWMAAQLTWRFVPAESAGPDPRIPATAPVTAAGDADSEVEIAPLHLFGEAAEAPAAADEAPTEAPDTQLNLELTGVFAAGGGDGIAIIVVGSQPQSVFGVGDRVSGQARVDGIYADRVILERNGNLETLRLADESIATTPAREQRRRASGNREIQRIASKAQALRERLNRNPLELARMVRFQPYLRDGELIGYRIQPRGADAELLADLGLRPSDVVTEVNGMSLSDPAQAQRVLQRMRSARTISVTWLRDGREHRMTVPIGPAS